jgi:hypothetical protein
MVPGSSAGRAAPSQPAGRRLETTGAVTPTERARFTSVCSPEEAEEHLKRAVALFADVGGRPGELEPEIWKLVAW